jgi:superfamily II DNA or RNA helicase
MLPPFPDPQRESSRAPEPEPGTLVVARDALWRVMHVSAGATMSNVRCVTLRGADAHNRWRDCILLTPFDRLIAPRVSTSPRRVSRRRWMRAFRSLLANVGAEVAALADARVALLPHQIEPVLAMLDGIASRVLIADGVGLGKTIQAALILRALAARGEARRVLIVVPAGLRDQWQQEFRTRVGLASEVMDASTLAARVRVLPADINPWRQPGIFITSLDFIKQRVVLHGIADVVWDVVIVDEAHALTAGTDRAAAAGDLARQSRLVLLLTATPHDGSEAAFASLCRVGALDEQEAGDAIAVFRRTRRSLGLPARRRVQMLRINPTASERHLHHLLARYTSRVEREQSDSDPGAAAMLAMTVLRKRASSSTWSLLRSVERRFALLSASTKLRVETEPEATHQQRVLPFEDAADADDVPGDVLAAPGLANAHAERAWLSLLLQAGRRAMQRESKLHALLRLLRRLGDEPAIVYTEYRDTLTHILAALPPARAGAVAMLHGAMPRAARAESLQRFASGDATLLLATDAAGEGLNLQQRCRLVINIELPWNPNRLEQRVGRVDRLGQTRTVHAIHLVLADTTEDTLRETLATRVARIEDALTSPAAPTDGDCPATVWPSLRRDALEVVQALEQLRALRAEPLFAAEHPGRANARKPTSASRRGPARDEPDLDRRSPWIAHLRRRSQGAHHSPDRPRDPFAGIGAGLLCIWRTRIRLGDAMSCTAREVITPLHVAGTTAAATPEMLTQMRARLDLIAHTTIGAWRTADRPRRDRSAARDAAIHELMQSRSATSDEPQPLLFADIAAERDALRVTRWRSPPLPTPPMVAPPEAASTFEHSLALVLVIR